MELAWTCLDGDCTKGDHESRYEIAGEEKVKKTYRAHMMQEGHPIVMYDRDSDYDGEIEQPMHLHTVMGTDKGFDTEA